MTEKHDLTQSSNPDVQALLVVITGLAQRIETLQAQVFALAGEIAALPDQFVVPGPNGEAPAGTLVVNARSSIEASIEANARGVMADYAEMERVDPPLDLNEER